MQDAYLTAALTDVIYGYVRDRVGSCPRSSRGRVLREEAYSRDASRLNLILLCKMYVQLGRAL